MPIFVMCRILQIKIAVYSGSVYNKTLKFMHKVIYMKQTHPIPPFYREDSQILILGSFPSVKSREQMFFYGPPQNRFWRVLAAVFAWEAPLDSIAAKKILLQKNRIALWDVIASCEITGSSDSSIQNVEPNDIDLILRHCRIREIFVNGKTAERLYRRYILPQTGREAVYLPSTSPANAAWSLERLFTAWQAVRIGTE